MPSESDDDPVTRSSTEHYDRVGVSFRWPQILASASSIFFGFLLKIALNSQSYFTFGCNLEIYLIQRIKVVVLMNSNFLSEYEVQYGN